MLKANNLPYKKFLDLALSWLSKSIFYVKNYPNLSNFFFIEQYQFRSTYFVIDIFCQLQFLKHFIF